MQKTHPIPAEPENVRFHFHIGIMKQEMTEGNYKSGCERCAGGSADQWKEAFLAGEMGSELLMIRAQRMKEPGMAAAHLTGAKADAMQAAAENTSGAPAFATGLLKGAILEQDEWRCRCGTANKGKFCTQCGAKNDGRDINENVF